MDFLTSLVNSMPGAVAQGLIWGIMAIGVYITYRILDVADLTVDGSLGTGGAVCVVLVLNGVPVGVALVAATLAGMLAGLVTGLFHTACGIPAILAGILTQLALYSINLRIMGTGTGGGKANLPISVDKYSLLVSARYVRALALNNPIFVLLIFCAVLIGVLYWFFGTELGCSLRATGANQHMARAQGINTNLNKVLGLMISNGLVALSGALYGVCAKATREFYAKEGFIIVALGWILLSAMGALPFYISGEIPHYVDAFFETVSGFTTTGASVLTDVEAMSHGLLYWRSFTHWLGGMGMLVFLLAVVPTGKGAGYSIHLLRAESPGPSVGKMVPRMRQTASLLYKIYIVLTVLCVLFLLAGGMPLFDSLCTAFGTAGTGGFGIKNNSMADYSPYLQNVCTVFMALFGVNFSVYFLLLLREWRGALLDEELLLYGGIMLTAMFVIAADITPLFSGFGEAFHHASFTVSSVMTTTGFATEDFNLWPQLSRAILCILMVVGASAGSTGGGIKVARLLLLFKSLAAEVRRMLRPRSVNVVRVNGRVVKDEVLRGVNVYMAAYCAIAVASFLAVSVDDFSLETNLTAVLACFNNIGPGLDLVGPASNYSLFSTFSKVVLSLDMLLGRLEIFPIIVLFSRHTWNRTR